MGSLKDYERKRTRGATPEPFTGGRRGKAPIFVVQRHDARRLHYDRPIAASLEAFGAARRTTAEILDRMSEVDWSRAGTHSESGRYGVEDMRQAVIEARLRKRLNDLIAPDGPWPFGKTLRASDAYEAILAEPGVRYAERLRFSIDDPDGYHLTFERPAD